MNFRLAGSSAWRAATFSTATLCASSRTRTCAPHSLPHSLACTDASASMHFEPVHTLTKIKVRAMMMDPSRRRSLLIDSSISPTGDQTPSRRFISAIRSEARDHLSSLPVVVMARRPRGRRAPLAAAAALSQHGERPPRRLYSRARGAALSRSTTYTCLSPRVTLLIKQTRIRSAADAERRLCTGIGLTFRGSARRST